MRALTVKVLEDAAAAGSTLLPQSQVVLGIRGLAIAPACGVDSDLIEVARDIFEDAIVTVCARSLTQNSP